MFTVPLQDVKVPEHNEATFSCEVSKPGKPVKWFRNGKEIKPDKKHVVTADGCKHTLKIKDCDLDDTAEITAKVDDAETEAKLAAVEAENERNKALLEQAMALLKQAGLSDDLSSLN